MTSGVGDGVDSAVELVLDGDVLGVGVRAFRPRGAPRDVGHCMEKGHDRRVPTRVFGVTVTALVAAATGEKLKHRSHAAAGRGATGAGSDRDVNVITKREGVDPLWVVPVVEPFGHNVSVCHSSVGGKWGVLAE